MSSSGPPQTDGSSEIMNSMVENTYCATILTNVFLEDSVTVRLIVRLQEFTMYYKPYDYAE